VFAEVGRFRWAGVGLGWGELAEGAVRAAGVVALAVLDQYLVQVALIDDKQPVGSGFPEVFAFAAALAVLAGVASNGLLRLTSVCLAGVGKGRVT
jgi:hypothetical protein